MKRNVTLVRDRSGSCAIIVLISESAAYIANIGDSRAILVNNGMTSVSSISNDHKPSCPQEQARIESAGGRVY